MSSDAASAAPSLAPAVVADIERALAVLPVEALERARTRSDIELLLSDVVMPGSSGPELAMQLRVDHPGLRVLLVSGYAADQLDSRGVSRAGLHLLTKPYAPSQLLRVLAETLAS